MERLGLISTKIVNVCNNLKSSKNKKLCDHRDIEGKHFELTADASGVPTRIKKSTACRNIMLSSVFLISFSLIF